jgi:phosphate transport system permease protein
MNGATSRRRILDRAFGLLCASAVVFCALALAAIVLKILIDGVERLDWAFLISGLSHRPEDTGIWPGVVGSLLVVALTMLISAPIGIATAVYLEEFASHEGRIGSLLKIGAANLAGVPSIVYGLVGLAIFVRELHLGQSIIAGALTLSLVVLPMVVIVTQEALRAVPIEYREASIALGSTPSQSVRYQVLPAARRGIWTGLLLAFCRAAGETAPLIVVGAAYFVTSSPSGLSDSYTVLPMQIFSWSSDARRDFHADAAAATLVLMAVLLTLNGIVYRLRTSPLGGQNG